MSAKGTRLPIAALLLSMVIMSSTPQPANAWKRGAEFGGRVAEVGGAVAGAGATIAAAGTAIANPPVTAAGTIVAGVGGFVLFWGSVFKWASEACGGPAAPPACHCCIAHTLVPSRLVDPAKKFEVKNVTRDEVIRALGLEEGPGADVIFGLARLFANLYGYIGTMANMGEAEKRGRWDLLNLQAGFLRGYSESLRAIAKNTSRDIERYRDDIIKFLGEWEKELKREGREVILPPKDEDIEKVIKDVKRIVRTLLLLLGIPPELVEVIIERLQHEPMPAPIPLQPMPVPRFVEGLRGVVEEYFNRTAESLRELPVDELTEISEEYAEHALLVDFRRLSPGDVGRMTELYRKLGWDKYVELVMAGVSPFRPFGANKPFADTRWSEFLLMADRLTPEEFSLLERVVFFAIMEYARHVIVCLPPRPRPVPPAPIPPPLFPLFKKLEEARALFDEGKGPEAVQLLRKTHLGLIGNLTELEPFYRQRNPPRLAAVLIKAGDLTGALVQKVTLRLASDEVQAEFDTSEGIAALALPLGNYTVYMYIEIFGFKPISIAIGMFDITGPTKFSVSVIELGFMGPLARATSTNSIILLVILIIGASAAGYLIRRII